MGSAYSHDPSFTEFYTATDAERDHWQYDWAFLKVGTAATLSEAYTSYAGCGAGTEAGGEGASSSLKSMHFIDFFSSQIAQGCGTKK